MYPNPQEAIPLTARPNLDQYRKLAKELVKSCKSDDAGAIRAWTRRWLERLRGSRIGRSFSANARKCTWCM
jgi:hypothetical protein